MPKKVKTFSNVTDLLKGTGIDKSLIERVRKDISERQVSKTLFLMRCKAGISPEDMAKKLKCSVDEINDIEHMRNNEITLSTIVDYCVATQKGLSLIVSESGGIRIKPCLMKMS